jgi:hypothetical protein
MTRAMTGALTGVITRAMTRCMKSHATPGAYTQAWPARLPRSTRIGYIAVQRRDYSGDVG